MTNSTRDCSWVVLRAAVVCAVLASAVLSVRAEASCEICRIPQGGGDVKLCNLVMDIPGWRTGGTMCVTGAWNFNCYYAGNSKTCTPACPDGDTEACRLSGGGEDDGGGPDNQDPDWDWWP